MLNIFTRLNAFLTIILVLLTLNVFGQTESRDMSGLLSTQPVPFRGDDMLTEGVSLDLNEQALQRFFNEASDFTTLTLPISYEMDITLELEKVQVLTRDFILRTSGGDTLNFTPGIYYRGTIQGHEGFCSINLFEDYMSGLISIKGMGDFNLGKLKNRRNTDYIIYNDKNLKRELSFECHTEDPPIENYDFDEVSHTEERFTDCVKFYIEGDYALFLNKGGVTPATNYITELFAEVATIYENEDIGIEISEILIWETPDGYDQDDAGVALDQFEDNNPNFNGDLAQLFALGGNNIGGLAWVDVLCGWKPYAYENIDDDFEDYPNYSWSVEVVAHEVGHNFGSRHTHACVWNGNNTQIDDCGNEWAFDNGDTPEGDACYDNLNPILPSSGTVMSYCHLIWSIGIDLANGFGTQPGNLIRNRYNGAACLTECGGVVPDPPIADFNAENTEICAGEYLQFYDQSENNPDTWDWFFEGGDPNQSDEENPNILYNTPGVYDVELEVSNGGGTDFHAMPDYITVLANPISSFDYTIVNYSEVIFDNNSSNADGYFWDFGDGDISYEENPTHIYQNDGLYTVTLYAEHNVCNEDVYSLMIEIISPCSAGMDIPVSTGCAPLTVAFEDASSNNVNEWNWSFEGGTPATSIVENPTIDYTTPGTYNVSLEVSNDLFSDVLNYIDTIKVIGPANAGFTTEIDGNSVAFTNTSNNATSYLWNFGDGENSSEENPVHEYAASGDYNVQLIASNSCGNDTTTLEIVISAEANASFFVQNDTICVNDTAYFSSTANTQDIEWIFEGGTPMTSTEIHPTIAYANAGTFMVTQYAYNSFSGDTLAIDNYITVLADPTGGFTSLTDGYTTSFTQSTSNATGFHWLFGDGETSNDENPSHTYSEDGTYQVTLTVYGICDTLTIVQDVEIANPPVAGFTMDITSGCASFMVQFTNQSSNNTDQYEWTFEGGNPSTSNEENPVVTYETAGVYSVLLQAINEQGQDVFLMEDIIIVTDVPEIDFSYSSSLLTFDFTYEGNPDEFISWDFGDGNTSTVLNPTHTYADEGFYEVTVNAGNDCGNNDYSQTVEAAIKPEADFTYDIDQECAPVTVNYTNLTSGNPDSFVWLFEGGTPNSSTDKNPEVVYYQGGTFSTQLIAFSNNGNDTLLLEEIIHVNDGPDAQFYFIINGTTVTFFNETENANSYIWNFGDGTASVEENPVHTYTENGDYTVTLYANNECGQQATEVIITISGVNTTEPLFTELKLYPNPNEGRFEITVESSKLQDFKVTVYDLLGKVIDNKNIESTAGTNRYYFDCSTFENGFYILQLDNGKTQERLKFAIQR